MSNKSKREAFPPGARGAIQLNWRRRLEETFGFLEQVREAHTISDLSESVLRYMVRFGATGLLAGVIPPVGALRGEQMSHVLLDAWPREWSLRYFSRGYLHRDPTIGLVRRVSEPFVWREIAERCELSASAHHVMHEAAEFRLRDGMTLAFSTVERRQIGFSIAGERLELDPSQRDAVGLIAAYAIGRAVEICEKSVTHQTVRLSPRQHDVLRWAAEGLTVDEIGDRLGVSNHTADTHLRAVREKLGVTSTVRAVAEAFRIGLIA
ncbi:LuxR family transcriptional regulator [Mesorhizobium sp.]|uniref:helix-turn-helix transcriptional regulator n=1 Tax=Mesorhizobium sp. TaxID=1871066 RepID=UPI001213DDCD|nr:LuxR family transcriptional regulator [Mesorhizobium sp.]TIS98035.1 MAG: LuxR family transcriptional regulator [Mesorhizobium sp.]